MRGLNMHLGNFIFNVPNLFPKVIAIAPHFIPYHLPKVKLA